MEKLAHILAEIENGDIPSFEQINEAFPKHPGLSWQIRTAAQGGTEAAIFVVEALFNGKARWHIGYDNRATVEIDGRPEVASISVTPGHALIIATLAAYGRTPVLAHDA